MTGGRQEQNGLFAKISSTLFKSKKAGELNPAVEPALTSDKSTKTEHCMICGEVLSYHEKSVILTCNYCAKTENGHITCPKGHYVCDHCHNQDAIRIIEHTVYSAKSADPFEIAELAMSFPGLPMLGCQHAYIAGGALMAALKNEGTLPITDEEIKEVLARTEKQAHGGYCGLTGVCGIVPAIGACFAVLTGSKCGTDKEQRTTMAVAGKVSQAITGLTGPSCCKAYVRSGLKIAVDSLAAELKIQLSSNTDTAACRHSSKHPHGCRKSLCPYFKVS